MLEGNERETYLQASWCNLAFNAENLGIIAVHAQDKTDTLLHCAAAVLLVLSAHPFCAITGGWSEQLRHLSAAHSHTAACLLLLHPGPSTHT